jgi:uncharacterized protein
VDIEETRRAAIGVWHAFKSRDPRRMREVLTDDVEWFAPPGNATATALSVTHHMVGPDAIIGFLLEDFPRLFSNGMSIEPLSVTAEGDRVVFEQRQSATLSNGRAFDLIYVFIFEMSGERVRRIREYMDTYSGHLQVGTVDHVGH